jgi:hypothetical protein
MELAIEKGTGLAAEKEFWQSKKAPLGMRELLNWVELILRFCDFSLRILAALKCPY